MVYFKVVGVGSFVLQLLWSFSQDAELSRSSFQDVGCCACHVHHSDQMLVSLLSLPLSSPFVSTSNPLHLCTSGVRSPIHQQNHSRLPDNLPCSCTGLDLCPLDSFLRSPSSLQDALITLKGLLDHSLDRLQDHSAIWVCRLLPPLRCLFAAKGDVIGHERNAVLSHAVP